MPAGVEMMVEPVSSKQPMHEREVREVMTAGVVVIVEDASVRQDRRAMQAHRVHAVLAVGRSQGRPLGWVTARGLLSWVDRDETIGRARDAITEPPTSIEPEGVLSEPDLLALGRD